MAQCQSGSYTYLNHECYTYLKDKFDNAKMGGYSLEEFEKKYNDFKTKNDRHSWYHPVLYKLITYTNHDGVFILADPRIPCNFINYLLNYELRNTEHIHHYISDYEIYKEFVRDIYKQRRGRYHENKVCDVHIKDLEEVIFQRMKNLYQLYDEYNSMKKHNEKVDSAECNKLSKFARLFNDTASKHGTVDHVLLKRLTDLRNLIEKRISSSNYNCYTNINFFHLPETRLTVQEKPDQDPSQEKVQQELTPKSPEKSPKTEGKAELLTEMIQVPKEPKVPEATTSSREPETATTRMESHHPVEAVSLKPLEYDRETRNYGPKTPHISGISDVSRISDVSETSHESVPSYLSSSFYKPETFHGLERSHVQKPEELYSLTEEEKGSTVGGIYPLEYPRSNPAAKEGGVSGILSSISGVLGDVDPVPVVGVSGGMGALFLLFRYTPVGTFFRGSRRRQRIPTRFYGEYPGFFPGFEGFEEGYFPGDQINIAYGRE